MSDLSFQEQMERAIDERIRLREKEQLRKLGGVPVATSGALYNRALMELNHAKSDKVLSDSEVTQVADLIGVINAMTFTDPKQTLRVLWAFTSLMNGRTLTPIHGAENEWVKDGEEEINIRDPRVRKVDGKVYFTQARAFQEGDNFVFKGRDSWQEITLPFNFDDLNTEKIYSQ